MDYLDERGTNPIREWLADPLQVPKKAKAKIDTILRHLAGQARWCRPLTSNLDDYQGLVEIRVLYMNVQYRLLGCWGPGREEFTILYPAKEVGGAFDPPNAPSIAQARREIILSDRRRVCEHRFG